MPDWCPLSEALSHGYITTYTGRKFRHVAPTPEMVHILDIAHALSQLCHWGGHSSQFVSVAQHSVLVSQICPPELARSALLHDAGEAYYGDVLRPLKVLLPLYRALEKQGMKVIAEKFDLPWPEPKELKQFDNLALAIEARHLMREGALHDGYGRPLKNLGPIPEVDFRPLLPSEAKALFLRRYAELFGDDSVLQFTTPDGESLPLFRRLTAWFSGRAA